MISLRSTLGALALLLLAWAPAARAEPVALDLAPYRGKVVLVDFWASWCGPCKQAFPFMAGLTHRYRATDFVVITVNEERQRTSGEAFLRQVQSPLPVIWDSAGTIGKAWAVNEMPTSLLFDRKGKMRFRHQGFVLGKTDDFQAQLAGLINER